MNKNIKNFIISILTIFFLFHFLLNSEIVLEIFINTTKQWFYHLLPSIFVFFIITDILNNYHFPDYLCNYFGKIFSKLFKIPKESSYILFMSMTSGFPGNSKLIKEQLDNHTINSYEASKLLTMTHFSNPLFIIHTIGINIFNNKKIGIIILIVHYLSNFIIGLLFRNTYYFPSNKEKKGLSKPLPFMIMLYKSITNTFTILLNVLGIILFFAIINSTINQYLHLTPFNNVLVNGLLEITNGLSLLNNLHLDIIKTATLTTFFISFGGFSIHLQIMSILNKYTINYYLYLLARIIHASISSLAIYIILHFM